MERIKEVVRVFNENADYYDEWYKEPLGKYVLEAELKALKSLIPERGLGLDVGGGTGEFSSRIGGAREVICLDPAINMLRRAKLKGVECVAATAGLPPFRASSFDFLILIAVLEFLEEPISDLKGLKKLLKSGSPLILMFINKDSEWCRFYAKLAEEGEPILGLAKFYSPGEVVSMLNSANYEVRSTLSTLSEPPGNLRRTPEVKRGIVKGYGVVFISALAKV